MDIRTMDKQKETCETNYENDLCKNCDTIEDLILNINSIRSDEECSISSRISNLSCNTISGVGSFSDVTVRKSRDVHIGHKIFAAPVTLVNNIDDKTNKKTELKKSLCSGAAYRVKNATRMEITVCILVVMLIAVISILTVYIIIDVSGENQELDNEFNSSDPNANWYINRDGWLAEPGNNFDGNTKFHPIKYVILGHTVTSPCKTLLACASEVRVMQAHFMYVNGWFDIAYNFLVGGDGRVYEGIGWYLIGAHTLGFNNRSIGINFIGDYRSRMGNGETLTEDQVLSLNRLLDIGVALEVLHKDFIIMCHCDVVGSASPGDNAYDIITAWPRYQNVYNQSCAW